MHGLYRVEPKHMRKIWGNVTGERLWYALHGYDIQAPETERGMFGHGRVLPPESRALPAAYEIARTRGYRYMSLLAVDQSALSQIPSLLRTKLAAAVIFVSLKRMSAATSCLDVQFVVSLVPRSFNYGGYRSCNIVRDPSGNGL